MPRNPISRRRLAGGLLILAGWFAVDAVGDDRDLLRFATANPYLFIVLDTSSSMNTSIGDSPVALPGFGDHPSSRIYAAKEALFTVLSPVDDVNYGFASLNQDRLRVETKHWLYTWNGSDADLSVTDSLKLALPDSSWPLSWPMADTDGIARRADVDGDGIQDLRLSELSKGDHLAVGARLRDAGGTPYSAGSCASPTVLPNDVDDIVRKRFDLLPKGPASDGPTEHWLKVGNGNNAPIYRIEATHLGVAGAAALQLQVEVRRQTGGNCNNPTLDSPITGVFTLRQDPDWPSFLHVDEPLGYSSSNQTDEFGGLESLWPGMDVNYLDASNAANLCSNPKPFSGRGWEGNYDGDLQAPNDSDPSDNDLDRYLGGASWVDLKHNPTDFAASPLGRELDRGDMLPFDWRLPDGSNKARFLRRLAPNCTSFPCTQPDFSVARYFSNTPGLSSALEPLDANQKPLIAAGQTPLGKAMLDFRCWYIGRRKANGGGSEPKCSAAAFSDEGWDDFACSYDPDYGCRRPYLVVISDGVDTCPGENPSADVAAMFNRSGIKTWALNLGAPRNCTSNQGGSVLHSITTGNGGGECINVANKQDLLNALTDILGFIREQATTFSSAAVPTVRAEASDSLYISNFLPINNASQWPGHLNAFLRPLPLTSEGKPDSSQPNFQWDAGQMLLTQSNNGNPLSETLPSRRRVFYSTHATSGGWPAARRLLEPTGGGTSEAVRYDLWRGFNLIEETVVTDSLTSSEEGTHQTSANDTISLMLSTKTAAITEPTSCFPGDPLTTSCTYLLGDIFHSNPLVVDAPSNSAYFAADLESEGKPCLEGDDADRGYRCYFRRHKNRRRVVYVGANDGMLHAFNAGIYDKDTGSYTNGSGNELFGYLPRTVLPEVRRQVNSTAHGFSVDGSPVAADVFIDPAHNGTPTPADRRWRTVLIGGLREGGSSPGLTGNPSWSEPSGQSYFALDITQPDKLKLSTAPASSGELVADGVTDAAYVPTCTSLSSAGTTECGPVAYPAPLWELVDDTDDSIISVRPSVPVLMDEDANQVADLGYTWSFPSIGRIRICTGSGAVATDCDPKSGSNKIEDRYVAVFGGGMDPENKGYDPRDALQVDLTRGSWLYMVDIETGQVLYKRKLVGAVPSEPAGVDTDFDGYLDRIYIGTLAGLVYRVDLRPDVNGLLPRLTSTNVRTMPTPLASPTGPLTLSAKRILVDSNGDPVWEPRAVFDANVDADPVSGTATASTDPRQIYFRPAVVFVGRLGLYGLAFGTGDREDLWLKSGQPGRFYVFVDDTDFLNPTDLPLDESRFAAIQIDDPNLTTDLLLTRADGEKGWYLILEDDERVTTDAFSLLGVTFFSSFLPDVATTASQCDPQTDPSCPQAAACNEPGFDPTDTDNFCSKTGDSAIFLVGTTNGNSFLVDGAGTPTRTESASDTFVSNPYTEVAVSGAPDPARDAAYESLKSLFPEGCRFLPQRIRISVPRADTAIQQLVEMPVCLLQRNWKEVSQ